MSRLLRHHRRGGVVMSVPVSAVRFQFDRPMEESDELIGRLIHQIQEMLHGSPVVSDPQ